MAATGKLKQKRKTPLQKYDIISNGPFDGKWISQWKTLRGVNEVPFESQLTFQGWSINPVDKSTEYRTFSKTLDKEFYLNFFGNDAENALCMLTLEDSNARIFAIETQKFTPFLGEIFDEKESYYIRVKDTTRYIAIDDKNKVLVTSEDRKNAVPWKVTRKIQKCNIL